MKFKPKDKRGQVDGIATSILIIVISTFILVLGFIMVQELRDTTVLNQAHSVTTNFENVTNLNNITGQALSGTSVPGANSFTVQAVHNQSNLAQVVASGNYSVNSNGTVILTDAGGDSGFNGTTLSFNYTFSHGGTAWEQTNSSLFGLSTFASMWDIIVLAIVIGIVLTLLIRTFAGQSRRR